MFLKYLKISKHTEQNPWKKTLEELSLAKLQAFNLQLFIKKNIYAGRFKGSNFFKKDLFQEIPLNGCFRQTFGIRSFNISLRHHYFNL